MTASQAALVVKNPPANAEDIKNMIPGSRRFPEGGNGNTPVLLLGEFHGHSRLAGYGPWGHKELDMAEVT